MNSFQFIVSCFGLLLLFSVLVLTAWSNVVGTESKEANGPVILGKAVVTGLLFWGFVRLIYLTARETSW